MNRNPGTPGDPSAENAVKRPNPPSLLQVGIVSGVGSMLGVLLLAALYGGWQKLYVQPGETARTANMMQDVLAHRKEIQAREIQRNSELLERLKETDRQLFEALQELPPDEEPGGAK